MSGRVSALSSNSSSFVIGKTSLVCLVCCSRAVGVDLGQFVHIQ